MIGESKAVSRYTCHRTPYQSPAKAGSYFLNLMAILGWRAARLPQAILSHPFSVKNRLTWLCGCYRSALIY